MKRLHLALFTFFMSVQQAFAGQAFDENVARQTWDVMNRIEYRDSIPTGLLQAMGLVESGHKFGGKFMPWPYAVNVNKTVFETYTNKIEARDELNYLAESGFDRFDLRLDGERKYGLTRRAALNMIRNFDGEIMIRAAGISKKFETKEKAVSFVQQMKDLGITNIDVGVMQVNLKYHGDAFASLDDAFDPYTNVNYAVTYLMQHRKSRDWWGSVGRYHSGTGLHAKRYVRTVYDMYQLVHGMRG